MVILMDDPWREIENYFKIFMDHLDILEIESIAVPIMKLSDSLIQKLSNLVPQNSILFLILF